MYKHVLCFMAMMAVIGAGGAVHAGDTCTFTASLGDWRTIANWDCGAGGSHVPGADDVAVIDTGNTCNVDATAQADRIDVKSTATLNIETSKVLTLDSDGGSSTVNGSIYLQGAGSELAFIDNVLHSLNGTGKIVGQDEGSEITITFQDSLNSDVTIEGKLKIGGAGRFVNFGLVHANTDGTLHINTLDLADLSTADWKVSTDAGAVLKFETTDPVAPSLNGTFTVELGILKVQKSIAAGPLIQVGGTVDVVDGAAITFN